jgi:hypothetical protein
MSVNYAQTTMDSGSDSECPDENEPSSSAATAITQSLDAPAEPYFAGGYLPSLENLPRRLPSLSYASPSNDSSKPLVSKMHSFCMNLSY